MLLLTLRGNQVCGLRIAIDVGSTNRLLHRPVGLGDSLVLAQVLKPGFPPPG